MMKSLLCSAALLVFSPSTHAYVVPKTVTPCRTNTRLNAEPSQPQSTRRHILETTIHAAAAATAAAIALPSIANADGFGGMDEMAPVPREAYKKLPCGVTYADLRVGTGDAAEAGKKVNVQWVLRKSNGYFVDSSEVAGGVPFIFTIGDKGAAIEGVDEGLRGMKAGGTRRLLIPPRLAYVEGLVDGKPGPLPAGFGPRTQMKRVQQAAARTDVPGEFIFLEVQMTKVR